MSFLEPLAYERQAIQQKTAGIFYLEWRRQGHKTTTLAKIALKMMMKHRGILVTFCSASLLVGRELIYREGQILESARDKILNDARVLQETMAELQTTATKGKLKLETNADGLKLEDFADIFEKQRLEFRVWHSNTVCSRTLIIAPNAATAVGYSGWVIVDETGRVRDLKDLLEAVEPIISSDPRYRMILAGTPPPDDGHYSYELTVPPEGMKFEPNAKGHWYESQAGILVHRVDSYDAAAAGLKTYSLKTREVITPEQHRAEALDRNAWDRNYGLKHLVGGTAAVSFLALQTAMARGVGQCVFAEDDFPTDWRRLLGRGRFALGYDVATTEDNMSNPSSLTVMEQVNGLFWARLKLVWKTADPDVAMAILREALDLGDGRHVVRLCVDASNERYHAVRVQKAFRSKCIVDLIVAGEKVTFGSEDMNYKSLLGNKLVNAMEDGRVVLPESRYVKDDYRLVKRDKGSFRTETDSQGRHGDTFDSDKLALFGLTAKGGPVQAEAVPVGNFSQGRRERSMFESNTIVPTFKGMLAAWLEDWIPRKAKKKVYNTRGEPAFAANRMDVDSLRAVLAEAEVGNVRDLFALYRDVMVSSSHLQTEFEKKKLAVLGDPISIQPADKKKPDDVVAQKAIEDMIDGNREGFIRACNHLMDGHLWPVALIEKVFKPSTKPGLRFQLDQLIPVPHLDLDYTSGFLQLWELDPDTGYITGMREAPNPNRYVVHRGHTLQMADFWGGPFRSILFWWLMGAMDRDWWARFNAPLMLTAGDRLVMAGHASVDRVASAGSAALAQAFRGSLAPVRRIIVESHSAEECEVRLKEFYADWKPERLAGLIEEALQAYAANGAASRGR
jgi:hypothetical protein